MNIESLKNACGRDIRAHIHKSIFELSVTNNRIGEGLYELTPLFPEIELRGPQGRLIKAAGVLVYSGVPAEEQKDANKGRDAVILTPGGLYVGTPQKTWSEDGKYALTVPEASQLKTADEKIYLEYGEKAIILYHEAILNYIMEGHPFRQSDSVTLSLPK